MTDLVERLRAHRHAVVAGRLMGEAADEIERQRIHIKELDAIIAGNSAVRNGRYVK